MFHAAPKARKRVTKAACPCCAARSSGVLPSAVYAPIDAPRERNLSANSRDPPCAARCSGVQPSAVVLLTSALCSSSRSTRSTLRAGVQRHVRLPIMRQKIDACAGLWEHLGCLSSSEEGGHVQRRPSIDGVGIHFGRIRCRMAANPVRQSQRRGLVQVGRRTRLHQQPGDVILSMVDSQHNSRFGRRRLQVNQPGLAHQHVPHLGDLPRLHRL